MPTFWPFLGNESFGETARGLVVDKRWPSASLLTGPRGVGKSQIALWVVQSAMCPQSKHGAPCGTCSVCRSIRERTHPDVVVLDGQAEAISIGAVREARQRFMLQSTTERWLVCLDADRLSEAAANALLKTLEEPNHALSILLTTSKPGQLPRTILSRCATFRLHRMAVQECPADERAIALRTAGRPELMHRLTTEVQDQDHQIVRDFLQLLDEKTPPYRNENELDHALDVEEEIIRDLLWRKSGHRTVAWTTFDEQLDQVSQTYSFERLLRFADQYAGRQAYLSAHVSLRNVYEDLHHL